MSSQPSPEAPSRLPAGARPTGQISPRFSSLPPVSRLASPPGPIGRKNPRSQALPALSHLAPPPTETGPSPAVAPAAPAVSSSRLSPTPTLHDTAERARLRGASRATVDANRGAAPPGIRLSCTPAADGPRARRARTGTDRTGSAFASACLMLALTARPRTGERRDAAVRQRVVASSAWRHLHDSGSPLRGEHHAARGDADGPILSAAGLEMASRASQLPAAVGPRVTATAHRRSTTPGPRSRRRLGPKWPAVASPH